MHGRPGAGSRGRERSSSRAASERQKPAPASQRRRSAPASDRPRRPPRVFTASRTPREGAIDAVIRRQGWDTLRGLLEQGGTTDALAALERLKAYMRMVLEWNRSVSNILSRNDEGRFVERHLSESIAPARSLRESGARRWVDFGSGAGLPAIPLAIAGVGASWTLVESRRSKTLFLRKTIQVIGLDNFEVVHDRLENVVANPPSSAGWDAFTSRATLTLTPTLELAAPLISTAGSAFLWKGSGGEAEMKKDPSWSEAWEFSGFIPIGTGPTTVARFTRK